MKIWMSLLILLGLSLTCIAQNGKARRSDGTECTAFPCVVATVSLTDQASPTGPIALVTPTTGGLYQLIYYLESERVKGSVWGVTFAWTDDLKTNSSGLFQVAAGNASTYTYNMRGVAGQPITYAISRGQGNPGGNTYNIFISVVQIQ